jgi:hypothetical protein
MKNSYWAIILVAGLLFMLSGCALKKESVQEVTLVQATEADAILACVAENKKFSGKEFDVAYKTALVNATRSENPALSPLVCLSLHQQATYKQFKRGMEVLEQYTKTHQDTASLLGLLQLLQQLNRVKIGNWAQHHKKMDEKEELANENKDLLERIEILEKNSSQDQIRIKALQHQIEQLINIENIIKTRER